MGNQVVRSDFDWTDDYHTHSRRRDEILRHHPEIKSLMVVDTTFKWRVLFVVGVQFISFYLIRDVDSFWILAMLGYFFGGVLNHSLTLAIHDICHNQAFGYAHPVANKLFGIIANLPIGIPQSVTFRKYHLDHHRYLGKQLDTDVPTKWEGEFFNTSLRKVLWIFLQPFFYAFRPIWVSPKPIEPLEIVNAIVQLSFNYLVWQCLGAHVVGYMILSSVVCMGLHPMAGHFISEHYVFFYEEDYLRKLNEMDKKHLADKLLVPETHSYYGPMNLISFNVGYHVEHHDYPNIPSLYLPKVKQMAPEFYEPLCYHTSWTKAIIRYIIDPRMSPFARIRRRELHQQHMLSKKAQLERQRMAAEEEEYNAGKVVKYSQTINNDRRLKDADDNDTKQKMTQSDSSSSFSNDSETFDTLEDVDTVSYNKNDKTHGFNNLINCRNSNINQHYVFYQ